MHAVRQYHASANPVTGVVTCVSKSLDHCDCLNTADCNRRITQHLFRCEAYWRVMRYARHASARVGLGCLAIAEQLPCGDVIGARTAWIVRHPKPIHAENGMEGQNHARTRSASQATRLNDSVPAP